MSRAFPVVVTASLLVIAGALPPAAAVPVPAGAARPAAGQRASAPPTAVPARSCGLSRKADCHGADLRGADLRKRDLRGVNLRGADLRRADLRKVNLRGADLRRADLRGADLRNSTLVNVDFREAVFDHHRFQGADLTGASFNNDQATTYALPDDGKHIVDVIDAAQHTVDVVIYEIGGPNVVGQAGAPGALMRAVTRGVDVRVVVNGQWYDKNCSQDTPQSQCATNPKLSWIYATKVSLQAAADAAVAAGSTPGSFSLNFANNNFQVTHQKTILTDAADPTTGAPLAAAAVPDGAHALVSTGNLQSFGWAYKSLTNPLQGCTENNCLEWSARDFLVDLQEKDLIAEIERVFFSDLHCGAVPPDTTPSTTNTNGLLDTPFPLVWANGSTWPQGGVTSYPAPSTGYPYDPAPGTVLQGGARQRILDVIDSASSSLLVYNEEMNDNEIIAALVAKAKELGPGGVKVVMTVSTSWFPAWYRLAQAGASIRVTQADVDPTKQTPSTQPYVHGKAVIADQTDAFVGSQNISYASLNYNRELGVMMTTRGDRGDQWLESVQGVQALVDTFFTDYNTAGFLNWDLTPAKSVRARTPRTSTGGDFPMLCGPIP